MCMVFRYKTAKNHLFEETPDELATNRKLVPADPEMGPQQNLNKMKAWKQRRESLLKQLKNCGLNLFCYYSRDRDDIFVKIGADTEKLCLTAARMKYKLQLKPEYLSAYAEYRQDFRGRSDRGGADRRHYAQMYERRSEDVDAADDCAIFTTRDKIMLIHHCITSKDRDCAGMNLGLLRTEDNGDALLRHYFPLHEERKLEELSISNAWRQWIWMGTEHTHKVRDYFGDKVAFYYLWMSFYWKWLIVPGAIGAVLQVLDVMARTPDNVTAVPFCVFLAIWTLFLPHFWRRQEAKYAIAWGTFDLVPELEMCRPEHWGEPRINPVTAQVENYFPWQKRMRKYMWSGAVMIVTAALTMVFILGLLFARHTYPGAAAGGIVGWQFIMAVFVELFNQVLTAISKYLTAGENHRTRSEHENHLLAKVFVFKFINSYFVLYWIAFFKRHSHLFGATLYCLRDDCMLDLQLALAIFMVTRLVIQNLIRFVGPKIRTWYRREEGRFRNAWYNIFNQSDRIEIADMSPAELQSRREPYDPFQNFDETLVTHGYATIFAVAAPWVCTATLFWTIGQTVLDVKSLTDTTQRPLPIKVRTNEPWDTAFDIYGFVACVTNVVLLVFGSEEYGQWTFTERLMIFMFILHLILGAKLLVMFLVPSVPQSVSLLHLKQANMVHRCLENIKVEPQQDFSLFRQHGADNFEIMEQDHMGFDDDEATPVFTWPWQRDHGK